MRRTLTTLVVGAALALTGGVAHATTQAAAPQVKIRIASTSTICGEDGKPVINATLYNDAATDETAVVYLEPNAGGNTLGVPVGNGQAIPQPTQIPGGKKVGITLPYEDGSAVFMAVAVAKGGTVPTMWQSSPPQPTDLKAMRAAGTAADQEIFPADSPSTSTNRYPVAPAACTPPPPTGCPPNWPSNPFPASACPTPTVTVTVTATKQVPGPTVTKTSATTVTSTVTSTATKPCPPGSTTTVTAGAPFPGNQSTVSVDTAPVATGKKLAHTGASVVLPTVVAVVFLALGAGVFMLGRRRARRH